MATWLLLLSERTSKSSILGVKTSSRFVNKTKMNVLLGVKQNICGKNPLWLNSVRIAIMPVEYFCIDSDIDYCDSQVYVMSHGGGGRISTFTI